MADGPSIVVSADDRFAVGAWITMWSAATHWRGDIPPVFHLLTKDPSGPGISRLIALAAAKGITLKVHPVDMAAVGELPTFHYNQISYLRILAPHIVNAVSELLYLDADVLVRDSLHTVFGSTGNTPVAAVREYGCIDLQDGYRYLEFAPEEARRPYVNAGLLLINVPEWKRLELTSRMLEFLHTHKATLHNGDQDAVNAVLRGNLVLLDDRWNVQTEAFAWLDSVGWPKERADLLLKRSTLEKNAGLVHFIGVGKPWEQFLIAPYASEYRRALFDSGWIEPSRIAAERLRWSGKGLRARARKFRGEVMNALRR